MTIYIDNAFKCHVEPADDRFAIDTSFFDGRCTAFIEGYRFVPAGSAWTREDGEVFDGEMATPWKDYAILEAAQQGYEECLAELQDMQAALNLLGVSPTEEVTDNG